MADDALVIGGGPAGAGLAILLARAGVRVRLLERTRGPHDKVCGEFISTEAIATLGRLGLDPLALGGVPIGSLGISGPRGTMSTPLPFQAAGLSRRVMDEALLARAKAEGARVERGVTVRSIELGAGRPEVIVSGGRAIAAPAVFVATGKHDLAGHPRPDGRQPGLIGLKMHYRLPDDTAHEGSPTEGRVDLLPLRGGYAGLQPIAPGLFNLCALVDRDKFASLGGWPGVLAELGRRAPDAAWLGRAKPVWPKPCAIARIPYGFIRREAAGLWWLGDQAAVIPSFSGDGMAIALHSAERAAAAYLAGRSAESFQEAFAEEVAVQVGRATMLSRFMVRPWFQRTATLVVSTAPVLARRIARQTRIRSAVS